MMKKIIAVVLCLLTLVIFATGCGKTATCDYCGEEKKCTQDKLDGKTVNVCDSDICKGVHEGLKAAEKVADNLKDALK